MTRSDLAPLDADIRAHLDAGRKGWKPLREKYPDVAESTFFYRVKAVRKRQREAEARHRTWLKDPLASASARRDPVKLFVDLDLQGELDACWALRLPVRHRSQLFGHAGA